MSKMLQVRNVPDDVHAVLRQRAKAAGMSLSDYALLELSRLSRRPTLDELFERGTPSKEALTLAEAREAVVGSRPDE